MNLKKLLTMTFATVMLVGCTTTHSHSSTKNPSTNSTTPSNGGVVSPSVGTSTNGTSTGNSSVKPGVSSSTTTPDIPWVEEYLIRIVSSNGVTVVPSATQAEKGTVITLTVTVAEGYKLEALTINNAKQTPIEQDGKLIYSFTMPDFDVTVKTTVDVDGEVKIVGDVAAPLVLQEDGKTWAAHDIEINARSFVAFNVAGTNLSVTQIDRTKTFADIEVAGSGYGNGFILAGGAKYSFYYNPDLGEECCYVKRTEVTRLPYDYNSLWSLFDGKVKSEPSTYPENLVGVTYLNTETNVSYEWNLFDDNSSYAVVKRLGTSKVQGEVYKKLENGVYTVVDTYIEGKTDTTRAEDTRAFSAKYKVVDEVATGFKEHHITEKDALFDIVNPSHDTHSIDFDIHYGYRTGFDNEFNETLKAYKNDVKSTKNADGTFTVDVDAYKTYESSGTETTEQRHMVYKTQLVFDKAGAILNGTYSETKYNSSEYDFSKLEFLPGGQAGGIEVKALEFEYKYGEPTKNEVNFDTSPYFVKSLSATINNNELYPTSTNTINRKDLINDFLKIDVDPSTALDVWQYRVIDSSNNNVIKINDPYSYTDYIANTEGKSTLTIGNDSTNDVTIDVEVTVAQAVQVRGFYMQGESNGRPVNDDNVYANYLNMLANTTKNVFVAPSPAKAPVEFTATVSNEDLVKVTIKGQVMTIDTTGAKDITTDTTVKITIHSDFYETYEYQGEMHTVSKTVFSVNIKPNGIPSTGVVGTWACAAEGVVIEFTDTQSTHTFSTDYKVAYVTTATESNIEIAYRLNTSTGVIDISGASINGNTFVGYFRFTSTGTVVGCLAYEVMENWDSELLLSDICGMFLYDSEGCFDDVNSVMAEFVRQ